MATDMYIYLYILPAVAVVVQLFVVAVVELLLPELLLRHYYVGTVAVIGLMQQHHKPQLLLEPLLVPE